MESAKSILFCAAVGSTTGIFINRFLKAIKSVVETSSSESFQLEGKGFDDGSVIDSKDAVPRRVRKCETVLSKRTDRIILVVEKSCDPTNQFAILRTAEALGIQYIHFITNVMTKVKTDVALGRQQRMKKVARTSEAWIDVRHWEDTTECVNFLKAKGYEFWATDLSQKAVSFHDPDFRASVSQTDPKVALVVGRETDGVSQEMLSLADRRLYFPLVGFGDSLNLSVATSICLRELFCLIPTAQGRMDISERKRLRAKWIEQIAGKKFEEWKQYITHPVRPWADMRRPQVHRNANWTRKKILKKQEQMEKERKEKLGYVNNGDNEENDDDQ